MSKDGFVGNLFGVKIIATPWYRRLAFWKYKKVMKGVWVKR